MTQFTATLTFCSPDTTDTVVCSCCCSFYVCVCIFVSLLVDTQVSKSDLNFEETIGVLVMQFVSLLVAIILESFY